jgi:hypothetical protein
VRSDLIPNLVRAKSYFTGSPDSPFRNPGDFHGRPQVRDVPAGEAQPSAIFHMWVSGEQAARKPGCLPIPGIHRITSDHPSEPEVQPLQQLPGWGRRGGSRAARRRESRRRASVGFRIPPSVAARATNPPRFRVPSECEGAADRPDQVRVRGEPVSESASIPSSGSRAERKAMSPGLPATRQRFRGSVPPAVGQPRGHQSAISGPGVIEGRGTPEVRDARTPGDSIGNRHPRERRRAVSQAPGPPSWRLRPSGR